MTDIELVDTPERLRTLVNALSGVQRVAVDLESNGMFAYRARVCTVQLAWRTSADQLCVRIVDTIACPLHALEPLMSNPQVLKIVHDLSFDARALHAENVDLRCMRDTAIAAAYLDKPATGLASLLASELGVEVSKQMQNSDWARRPLEPTSIAYLAGDVAHLLQLEAVLWQQVRRAGIEDEVQTETAYRLLQALSAQSVDPADPQRVRGYDRLDGIGRRVLELLTPVRDHIAMQQDLPPQRVLADRVMIALARERPRTHKQLARFGQTRRLQPHQREELLQRIADGIDTGPIAEVTDTVCVNPYASPLAREARKQLEMKLHAWRKKEAKVRQVNEQVVLPSHCLRAIVSGVPTEFVHLDAIPGFGKARSKRYAQTLLALVAPFSLGESTNKQPLG